MRLTHRRERSVMCLSRLFSSFFLCWGMELACISYIHSSVANGTDRRGRQREQFTPLCGFKEKHAKHAWNKQGFPRGALNSESTLAFFFFSPSLSRTPQLYTIILSDQVPIATGLLLFSDNTRFLFLRKKTSGRDSVVSMHGRDGSS